MLKYVWIGILLIFLAGCYQYIPDYPQFDTPDEVFEWVVYNIEYSLDTGDVWQTPEQTYEWRAGKCCDMALLEMYFLREMGVESVFLWVSMYDSSDTLLGWHALVQVEGEPTPRDSVSTRMYPPNKVPDDNGNYYIIFREMSYLQTMGLAISNRSIEDET